MKKVSKQIYCEYISAETELTVMKAKEQTGGYNLTVIGSEECKYANENGCKLKRKCELRLMEAHRV